VAQAIFTLPVDRGVIKEKGRVPRASRKGAFYVFYKSLFSLLNDQGSLSVVSKGSSPAKSG